MRISDMTRPELEIILEDANFTEEEEQIFRLLAKGLSNREISFRQSLCERSVSRKKKLIENKINKVRSFHGWTIGK